MTLFNVLYIPIALWLAIYGLNSFVLIGLYLKHRRTREPCPAMDERPAVTVQLPVYNEKYVVQRAIEHLVRLDWPRERLQIQVVDDSTDETTALARQQVAQYRRQGIDIVLIHRDARSGFKAGALNAALPDACGEFVAVFDADFCPSPDFLCRTVPHLAADPSLGFVQTRWGHLNAGLSPLTRAQAIALDGHHLIEHTARSRAGLLANFSGTGGVWRATCIRDSGGWDAKMLTEDVDLGYRAQLRGWKGLMLPDVVSPSDLPAQLLACKQQQFRWAKGNIQCLLKLALPLARAPVSLAARLQALIHLSYYLAHPLMLLVMLCALPLIWLSGPEQAFGASTAALLSLATLGPPLLYSLGQREI
ncbi:MAG: glycosyltransferase, partial [Anaerolineae bacterium]|nr:glycosyltransferase [Anaerolineae bacterium]